jgi:hypothetical protein
MFAPCLLLAAFSKMGVSAFALSQPMALLGRLAAFAQTASERVGEGLTMHHLSCLCSDMGTRVSAAGVSLWRPHTVRRWRLLWWLPQSRQPARWWRRQEANTFGQAEEALLGGDFAPV